MAASAQRISFFFGIDREARHFWLDQIVCPGDRRNYPKADVFVNFVNEYTTVNECNVTTTCTIVLIYSWPIIKNAKHFLHSVDGINICSRRRNVWIKWHAKSVWLQRRHMEHSHSLSLLARCTTGLKRTTTWATNRQCLQTDQSPAKSPPVLSSATENTS